MNTFKSGLKTVKERRERRVARIKKSVRGTLERPRLCITRSNKHFYVQVIDDESSKTLVAASSMRSKKEVGADKTVKGGNIKGAVAVGEEIAKKALEKGITKVVLDRRHYRYHGRVKAFAEAARKAGLKF
jgi:large subunit ribosomal protein L18